MHSLLIIIRPLIGVFVLLFFPACATVTGEGQLAAAGGWDKVNWGDSQDKVIASYPEARKNFKTVTKEPNVILERVDVGISIKPKAVFQFDSNNELMSVFLTYKSTSNGGSCYDAYEELLRSLKAKYGTPKIDDEWFKSKNFDIFRKSDWSLLKTQISLRVMGGEERDFPALLILIYSKHAQTADL